MISNCNLFDYITQDREKDRDLCTSGLKQVMHKYKVYLYPIQLVFKPIRTHQFVPGYDNS